MIFKKYRQSAAFICYISLVLLMSCSAERKNMVSKTFHNTTARYNAYYYAKERIKEIEGIIDESVVNDYNEILNIYPKIDSSLAKSYTTQIEDCIKKASIAIQRHPNSKWVDDSYNAIGLARFYSLDYVNAIDTYKFVNVNSENDDARHKALVRLIRTFVDFEEENNAIAVSDFLKKEKLNNENLKDLYLNRAYLYQTRDDLDNMVRNLVLAAPLMSKSDGRARIYFIIGQIYQKLGFESQAYNNYKKCLASNPEYELYFYARLNIAQVTELSKNSDVKSVRRHFVKLLKDKKNREFKDKIYYEMAEFEAKQGNLAEAVEFYRSSVAASVNNNLQKGRSYLKLGIIHFDSLKQYELAQAYYDSTVNTLPKDYDDYELIKERKEILDNFVTQINTIQLQDSLLSLAEMDSSALMTLINDQLKAKEIEQAEQTKKNQRRSNNFNSPFDNTGLNQIGSSTWYFGNPSAVSIGQNEFNRRWGTRVLEDNWRRSNKTTSANDAGQTADNQGNSDEEQNANGQSQGNGTSEAERLFAQVPRTESQKQQALTKVENAYYNLGNIYNFDLNEKDNASSTFETLLKRFPETEYEPEVLYLLYLIYNESNPTLAEECKRKIINEYQNTKYGKLLINPEYALEGTATSTRLKAIYEQAYNFFERNQLDSALSQVHHGLNDFPETIFTPRLKLLEVLIVGKTQDIYKYQYELSQFIETNPDSDLKPYAETLLQASKDFQESQLQAKGISFIKFFKQEHYFVLLYDKSSKSVDKMTAEIESFNESKFGDISLSVQNLSFDEENSIIFVSGLVDVLTASAYYGKFEDDKIITSNFPNLKIRKFVITKDNFGIFYQNQALDNYLTFFREHYQ
ncbi:MAG: tetratricopeptide repeat protein [Bacteroidota bacterium]